MDHDKGDFAVFEGAAILQYLVRFYDGEKKFGFKEWQDESRVEQWVAWQTGGLVCFSLFLFFLVLRVLDSN